MCLLFVKTVVVIIKSTEVPLNTLDKCKVIASPEEGGRVIPYIGYLGVCGAKEYGFFYLFWSKKGINFNQFCLDMFF